MKKFVIEREIEGAGAMTSCELAAASRKSNEALGELSPRVQWQHSYLTENGTFCIYLAENEDAIREHAERSGFPANRITEVKAIFDPATAEG
jgi:hypothetical protein